MKNSSDLNQSWEIYKTCLFHDASLFLVTKLVIHNMFAMLIGYDSL